MSSTERDRERGGAGGVGWVRGKQTRGRGTGYRVLVLGLILMVLGAWAMQFHMFLAPTLVHRGGALDLAI